MNLTPNERYRIIMALRRVYFMSDSRREVVKRCETATKAFKKDGTPKLRKGQQTYTRRYRCEVCGQDGLKSTRKKIKDSKNKYESAQWQVNHKESAGSTPGSKYAPKWWNWQIYMSRLFCPADKLEGICIPCHQKQTNTDKEDMRSGKFYIDLEEKYCGDTNKAKVYPGDDDK